MTGLSSAERASQFLVELDWGLNGVTGYPNPANSHSLPKESIPRRFEFMNCAMDASEIT